MHQAHNGVRKVGRAILIIAPALLAISAAAAAAQGGPRAMTGATATVADSSAGCLRCHALPNLGYRDQATAPVRSFTVAASAFHSSAHGKLSCRQCHTDIDGFPHIASAQRQRVSCGQDCHAVDSAGRPYTHAGVVASFRESVHGRAARTGVSAGAPGAGQADAQRASVQARATAGAPDPDAPTCLSCHGKGDAHAIVPPARMTRSAQMALCVDCHDDRQLMEKHRVSPEAVASYRRSFHYKAIRFGAAGTAICIDCHTSHHVLPPSDPRSSVAPAQLTKTCGQAGCHRGAGRNFAVSGANHLDLRVGREPLLWFEEKFFLVLTAGTMLMLLVGIVLDVQRKFGWLALLRRLMRALGRTLDRVRPSLARTGRRGLQVARQILID